MSEKVPDLADGLEYIAAHEPDPRKEGLLYEAADALSETCGALDELLALVRGECPSLFREDPLVAERCDAALAKARGQRLA